MNRIETTRLNRSGQVHIPTSGKFIVPCKFLITLLRFKEKRVFICKISQEMFHRTTYDDYKIVLFLV